MEALGKHYYQYYIQHANVNAIYSVAYSRYYLNFKSCCCLILIQNTSPGKNMLSPMSSVSWSKLDYYAFLYKSRCFVLVFFFKTGFSWVDLAFLELTLDQDGIKLSSTCFCLQSVEMEACGTTFSWVFIKKEFVSPCRHEKSSKKVRAAQVWRGCCPETEAGAVSFFWPCT